MSFYADDPLLYFYNLPASIPLILTTLESFGHISGYKLNLDKSELFPLNKATCNYTKHNLPFKISECSFVYLGVNVTDKFKDLYKANFAPVLTTLSRDFEKWSLLNLSLAARVNSAKMTTLLKLLYLFQCLPIFLPQTFTFFLCRQFYKGLNH